MKYGVIEFEQEDLDNLSISDLENIRQYSKAALTLKTNVYYWEDLLTLINNTIEQRVGKIFKYKKQ